MPFFTPTPRNDTKDSTALSIRATPRSWPLPSFGDASPSALRVCAMLGRWQRHPWVCPSGSEPLGECAPARGAYWACFQAGHSCPFGEAGTNCPCLIGQQKAPRGMGPGPPFAPNNHSEFMDFFRSLKSNDVLGQGQKTCLLVIIHALEALVTSREVKYLLGQL